MEIHSIGINYTHKNSVVINRPKGSGDNLLIIFKTPAFAVLNGIKINAAPDSAVLFSKDSPQLYGNENSIYINHCIHFDADSDMISKAHIKTDTVFRISDIDRAESLMKEISYEFYSDSKSRNETSSLLLNVLLYKLGESCVSHTDNEAPKDSSYYNALRKLRSDIYSTPAADYSIPEIAQKLCISVSHLQRLYKRYFGVSCYDDIINARISLAKNYLLSTLSTVSEVAYMCGYECFEHFVRQFRKRTGVSPTEYRAYYSISDKTVISYQ